MHGQICIRRYDRLRIFVLTLFKTVEILVLIQGDVIMLTATELSSDRIPWDDLETLGLLLGVSVGSWVISAVALGDYRQVVWR